MPSGTSRLMPALRRVALAEGDRTDGQLLGAFIAERDADAFAGLVRRHGPMVLGVCRRVTGDAAAADDAFQAVFLVLARRAVVIKPREQVGNWLYGVAYRTAIKARAVRARRRSREKQVAVMPEPSVSMPETWADLQPVIDEELDRLPDKLRLPVVLCDLEGRPQREVARQLGVPTATLATRLASARRTLAARLTRRGVTLSGGALAGLLTAHGSAAAVAPGLAQGLARAAEALAGGGVATSLVSPHALQLSEGIMRMMLLTKLKAMTVAVLTVASLTCGLGIGLVPACAGDEPAQGTGATGKTSSSAARSAAPSGAKAEARVKNARLDAAIDDETFLRRLMLELCGAPPTPVEMWLFTTDRDANKRAKVIGWLTQDEVIVARVAAKLGVPPEKIRVLRVTVREGKPVIVAAVASDAIVARSWHRATLTGTQDGPPNGGSSTTARLSTMSEGDATLAFFLLANNAQPANMGQLAGELLIRRRMGFVDLDNDGKLDMLVVNEAPARRTLVEAYRRTLVEAYKGAGIELSVVSEPIQYWAVLSAADSDAEFLNRVIQEARGTPPTTLEQKYFTEDKDPKKREKLLDALLKEPAVAKKLGEEWKKKMLASNVLRIEGFPFELQNIEGTFTFGGQMQSYLSIIPASRFEKLVDELLAAKKSDPDMLEAITLAAAKRLPTPAEKRLTLALISKATDRRAAWIEAAEALAGDEKAPARAPNPQPKSEAPRKK